MIDASSPTSAGVITEGETTMYAAAALLLPTIALMISGVSAVFAATLAATGLALGLTAGFAARLPKEKVTKLELESR